MPDADAYRAAHAQWQDTRERDAAAYEQTLVAKAEDIAGRGPGVQEGGTAMGVKALTVVGLLALPPVAHAACAWVVWVESWKMGGARYFPVTPEAAYETKAECESALKDKITSVAAGNESLRPGSVKIAGAVAFIKTEDGEIAYERKCLPDTLTPK